MNISIFGTGYVGLITGACLARLGHNVLCYDINKDRIALLQRREVPFYEPGLKELITYVTDKNLLHFTTDVKKAANADVVFNCVGTPMNSDGSANLEYVCAVAKAVSSNTNKKTILCNKSTVPPGTAQSCKKIVGEHIIVVSNPEFLREGNAIQDFTKPDKIIIGADNIEAFETMRKVYLPSDNMYLPIMFTDIATAEMIKYANNSFLATKISFINEIANICDKVGANVHMVSKAMGLDNRISPKFLNAGIGYGGSCFPKDVRALIHTAKNLGYKTQLLNAVDTVNNKQRKKFFEKVKQRLGDLNGKQVTILGLSFKPNTTDCRESPATEIIPWLKNEGAIITAHDPMANEEFQHLCQVDTKDNIESACENSDAIIILTEWEQYKQFNFDKVKCNIIFDARNCINYNLLNKKYYGVGI